MAINYRIEEAKSCGNSKESLYHIYVDGISMWDMPYLKQAKLFNGQYYVIWSRQTKEEVLSDFIDVYGKEFEKLC